MNKSNLGIKNISKENKAGFHWLAYSIKSYFNLVNLNPKRNFLLEQVEVSIRA